jgi:putative transposase
MSSHVFHEIYLRLNWHTKGSRALLTTALEPEVHRRLQDRCRKTKGVFIYGVGGTETHVHLAIAVAPFVCISDLVGELKGGSSFDLNQRARDKVLEWQRGFGVVSFGKKQLGWVLDYIANQKEHHARGTVFSRLERTTGSEDGLQEENA